MGQAIATDMPSVTGTVTSYSVSPALPAGLSLNATTGAIAGTPTAAATQTAYTITAANASGSTTATVTITVTLAAPSNLVYPQTTISATVGQTISTDTPSVTGTVTSYSVSPALPAGLSLNATTGAIYGTPTAAATQTAYTITATNGGGSTTATVTLAVMEAQSVLLELGHANSIEAIRFEGDRVLSADTTAHWTLWNYTSGALLASGDGVQQVANLIDMAGQTVVVGIENGLEVRAAADGHLLSMIAFPGLNPPGPPWTPRTAWKLASDGSYVCIHSPSGLYVYTPQGQMVVSKSGDYSLASIFAGPGQVLVAMGAAGQNVIESISIADGTSSVSATFSGQFNSWFVDGTHFLTNLSTTVWVYSSTGTQQTIEQLPTASGLGGQGNWIWTYGGCDVSKTCLEVYPLDSDTPALSVMAISFKQPFASGGGLGILTDDGTTQQLSVIDLSGPVPSRTDYALPVAYPTAYAATSPSQWIVGNTHGVLVDGASLSSPNASRYFGQGAAWSIAGSSSNVAVSTANGTISVFDPYQSVLDEKINFPSGKLALSSDGSVLVAFANAIDAQYQTDRTLNIYSLPSGNISRTLPYSYNVYPTLLDFSLATQGTAIGRVMGTNSGGEWLYYRTATDITGGSVLWSESGPIPQSPVVDPILLSPDGTVVATTTGAPTSQSATNIFKNGNLVTAVPGVAVGWIDNNRLLVNQYATNPITESTTYKGCTIVSPTGVLVATPPLTELKSIQTVNTDSVYDPSHNAIYSLTTGTRIWTASFPGSGEGAISGTYVVYESGHRIVVESY